MSTRLKNPAVINRFLKIPVVPGFLIALFMFRLADGVLGYIFPIVVEQELNSNLYMGLIMALSSITGLVCDFTFPTLISSKNWKQLLVVSILLALLFPLTTYLGQIFGLVIFFLLATIIWGIYFEFNIFSVQDYIIYQDKKRNFSKDWGLIGILVGMVEVVAPIIGASLLVISGPIYFAVVSIIFLIALYIGKSLDTDKSLDEVNKKVGKTKELIKLIKEVKMWELMAVRVWHILIMSFILQSIFATYLIFGGLFGQEITGGKENGWVIMFLYAFPSFVAGILLTKFIIKKRKKLISTALLITGGVIMSLIGFVGENKIIIGVAIFISSFMFTSAYILNNAVFSDIGAKLKKESNHLFGMLNATGSMSYIVVPLLLGMISDLFGYYMAFSFMGLIAIVTGVALFVFTPKKIKISETELNHIK